MDKDILKWLDEDIPYWDVSFDDEADKRIQGYLVAKDTGILAGITVAKRILELLNIEIISIFDDGQSIKKGDKVITFEGLASNILRAERVMINILSHMSGIATKTNSFTSLITKYDKQTRIAATRKTIPGLRRYQKLAITIGGGDTHRLNLSSMALIKENHIRAYGGVKEAVEKVKESISFSHKIEIEVTNEQEALQAAQANVDIIMLDNFVPSEIKKVLPKIREIDDNVLVEASGGIDEETIEEFVKNDVDIISLGALTHSVEAFDFSLLLEKN